MTMEMWDFGQYVERWKLVLLLVVSFPLFVGLSHHAGFEETFDWKDDVRDSCVAYAVAFVASAVMLGLFGAIGLDSSLRALSGTLALQAVPAGIGALLGRSLLQKERSQQTGWEAKYPGKLFLMTAGALFLGINIAPTDEIIIITHRINEWFAIVLALLSLMLMHAFVYAVEFRGGAVAPEGGSQWSLFLRFTVTGYALALVVSFYLLWTFSRTSGLALDEIATATFVLGFPAAIGAAAARLIL